MVEETDATKESIRIQSGRVHRVYLVPGMFGFGELAGYDYFGHVERALQHRFEERGVQYEVRVVPAPPTASIRKRAACVAQRIQESAATYQGHIHLVGHSTGGLDARLLASPNALLDVPESFLRWRDRLRTVVTINAPHYGTPLAQFFTTVSGARLLYVLSLLTIITLKVGGPPLTVFSTLISAVGGVDEALGIDIHLLDHATELILRFIGEKGRAAMHGWLDGIREDQGGIIQISPESMDLFNAAAENSPHVRYGCVASASPAPRSVHLLSSIRSPYSAFTATLYSTLYAVAARPHEHYLYAEPDTKTARMLQQGVGATVLPRHNDGIVPTLSMIWGKLLWCGMADHLDIVGHFRDDKSVGLHSDWLRSGARFGRSRFAEAMNSIADFLVEDDLT